jgi:nucleoside-diphosphate-sugar epimerase
MRVFFTDMAGYTASAVAARVAHEGHEVVNGVHDGDALLRRLADVDAVVQIPRDPRTPSERDARMTQGILRALEGTRRPFLYASSTLVTGDTGASAYVDETTCAPPPWFMVPTVATERSILASRDRGVHGVVIRQPVVYGQAEGLIPPLVESARARSLVQHIGSGENTWGFVHVEDLADLYARALHEAPPGTLLIGASDETRQSREVSRSVARAVGPEVRVKSWSVDLAQRTLGVTALSMTFSQRLSSDKARRLLRWTPSRPTVLQEIEWFVRGSRPPTLPPPAR